MKKILAIALVLLFIAGFVYADYTQVKYNPVEIATGTGTLTDGNICTYDSTGREIDCNTAQVPLAKGGTNNTIGASSLLAKQTTDVSVPATTDETTLYSVTIPANTMGANGVLRIKTSVTLTSSGNNKTTTIKFSGQTIMSSVITTNANALYDSVIINRNATNAQARQSQITTSGSSIAFGAGTATVDTTQDQILLITGTKASAGETLTLNYVFVEVLK